MNIINNISNFLSTKTTINKDLIYLVLMSITIIVVFSLIKYVLNKLIRKKMDGRGEYVANQSMKVIINIIEIAILVILFNNYIKNLVTLISIVSAALTIVLKELIVNFFGGIFIKIKKPFKVEDRIEVDDIRGDVINISSLSFELLEVASKENGQSTGIIVTFPNSIVFSKPIKNINKGFKYVWNELIVNVTLDCDLANNKKEIYKIVNNIETIKNIPRKMKNQLKEISAENRIYFNKYDPMIYTKIVDDHVELTIRYLMHPKKARYVESVIWNKIYLAYKDKKIDLYI